MSSLQVPPGLQRRQLELSGDLGSDSILEQLGDGGFDADDLQLLQLLGQLNFVMPQNAQRATSHLHSIWKFM